MALVFVAQRRLNSIAAFAAFVVTDVALKLFVALMHLPFEVHDV